MSIKEVATVAGVEEFEGGVHALTERVPDPTDPKMQYIRVMVMSNIPVDLPTVEVLRSLGRELAEGEITVKPRED